MKKLALLLLLFTAALSNYGQSEVLDLKEYDSIEVSGGIHLELYAGSPRAEIKVTKGELKDLVVEVSNRVLKIKFSKKAWSWNSGNQNAEIKLFGAQNLKSLKASAGSNVKSKVGNECGDFSLQVSSGANVNLELESETISAKVSSGGSINLEGQAEQLSISASSGGNFNGVEMKTKNCSANASSGGGASVWVTDRLNAKASSGGLVRYKGDPHEKNLDQGKYSGGNISKI